jgi:ribokinase
LPIHSVGDAALCARALLDKGFRKVVVTLGAQGSLLADSTGSVHIPAFPVSAVDTTGAGDAFIGSLAAFLGEGLPEKQALARANLFAALSTTAAGAQKSFPFRMVFEAEWDRRCETR